MTLLYLLNFNVWFGIIFSLWQEPDVHNGVNDDKRASLLMMKFSVNEVEFAIDKLGRSKSVKFSLMVMTLVFFLVGGACAGRGAVLVQFGLLHMQI